MIMTYDYDMLLGIVQTIPDSFSCQESALSVLWKAQLVKIRQQKYVINSIDDGLIHVIVALWCLVYPGGAQRVHFDTPCFMMGDIS